jgi:hypothetical protein
MSRISLHAQCSLTCTAVQAKENPAGLDAGFSAAGSGIQGQSRQLFPVRYDCLERKQQRCREEYVLPATLR